MESFITENGFNYRSVGKGRPILILHGLMGGLSNFEDVFNFFPQKNYNVIAPELPVYTSKLLDTNVKFFAKFVNEFVKFKKLKDFVIVGNSLGGHVGLIYAKFFPNLLKGLVLTGSSGLYENSMGDSYPKREDYNFIRKKTEGVFDVLAMFFLFNIEFIRLDFPTFDLPIIANSWKPSLGHSFSLELLFLNETLEKLDTTTNFSLKANRLKYH